MSYRLFYKLSFAMLFMLSIVILYYFPYLIDYRYNDIYIYLSFFPISLLILCYTIRLDSKVHFCQSCRSAIKSTIELNMCHKIDYRMRQFSCNFDKLKVIFFSTTVVVFFLSLHTHTHSHTQTHSTCVLFGLIALVCAKFVP